VIGEVLSGRYRVLERLGEGGHGFVYRGVDLANNGVVAVKVMHNQDMTGADLERFEREAELARRLRHPNIAQLLGFGLESDTPYLVFELVEGRPLSDLLKRVGALPGERVARIVLQVLRGLAEAHAVGIVHRDIKPANIMVVDRRALGEEVKLVDFGVAKSLRTNTRVITQAGEVPGTPSYMSPEHVESRPVAPSTDLFSLGLVMAEALTGKKVYGGSAIDVLLELVSPDPVPLPPEIRSSPLGPVIERATRKRMEERYQSAPQMLRDVELVLGGAVSVPTSNPAYSQSYPAQGSSPALSSSPHHAVPHSNPAFGGSSPALSSSPHHAVPHSNPAFGGSSPALSSSPVHAIPGSASPFQSIPPTSAGPQVPHSSPVLSHHSYSLPPSYPTAPSGPRSRRTTQMALLAVVAAGLLVALVVALVFLLQTG